MQKKSGQWHLPPEKATETETGLAYFKEIEVQEVYNCDADGADVRHALIPLQDMIYEQKPAVS